MPEIGPRPGSIVPTPATSSAGIDAIDVPYLDLEDPDGMEREACLVRDLGFSGKGMLSTPNKSQSSMGSQADE